ncbi:MAG TPA: TonB-dependent siderophore receptor [Steroidobacteraceae bacterium]|jgi:catecholate siderophore receptor|nr:TonB-dependent siderophore receptor [Steroidobacteraceae bacterium]
MSSVGTGEVWKGRAGSVLGVVGACVSGVLGSSALAAAPSAPSAPTPAAPPSDGAGPSPTGAADVADAAAVSNGSSSLEEVTVEGVRSLLLDKLGQDAQQTPQSVTVVGSQLMSSQADTRLEDALKNVPGITLNAGEGAARGDTVNLRGFSAFNDFYLDGVRDAAVYTRDSFDLQSVEVLKGPSAVLFGRGSTGGAINQVTKAPQLMPLDEATAEIASNDLYRATADLDTPLGASAAARLNLMGESSQAAERDDVRNRRFGVAPAVSFGLGDADTLTFAYLHQQEDDIPDVGMPFVGDTVANVPRQFDYGLTSDRTTTDDDILTARYRHAFSDDISLADTLRYANYDFNYVFDAPNFGSHVPSAGEPLADILVGRDAPSSMGSQTNLDEQIDLNARFQTGPISHQLAAGVEVARQGSLLERYNNPFNSNNNWVPETPLLAPDPYEVAPNEPITSTQHTVAPSGGAYVLDTLGFGPYVALSGGYRYDYFSADYQALTLSTGALTHLSELNRLGSPRAALLVTPTKYQTYYFSYGTSFDPSAEALTLTSKTADLGPVKAKTYEVGAKTLWFQNALSLTGALFHTEVDNAQTNDPDNPNITVLDGNERVNGFELDANGHLTQHWELTAGYTYLDGRTLASGIAADVGKVMPNVAHDALNLWTEYHLGRWEIGGGGNWLSKRYADSAESAWVPGYVVWNAMASVVLSSRLTVQLNGYNLFNKLYYDGLYYTSAAENHAVPGTGRSVALNARLAF